MKKSTILLTAFTVFTMASCSKKDLPLTEKVPVACFTLTEDTIELSDEIEVNAACSQGALTYLWSFGDGQTATSMSTTHKYSAGGDYTVSLTATNEKGTNATTKKVVVNGVTNLDYIDDFNYTDNCGGFGTLSIAALGSNGVTLSILGVVNGTISKGKLTIPSQSISGGTFSGTGTLSSDKKTITITYAYKSSGVTENCILTGTRQ
jgi:PKD repeat protein